MPKIVFKELTLNDQAWIIKYDHRDTFYLRIHRGGNRYTNVSLTTTDIQTAQKNALNAYLSHASEPPKSRSRKFGFEKAAEEFLKYKEIEVRRKQLKESSIKTYNQRLYQRIIPFAKIAGIKNIGDIQKNSFTTYKDYYLDISTKGKWKTSTSGLSASTINSDISTLCEFLKWCCNREYLDPRKFGDIPRPKDRKDYREDANPAFFPDEFARFKDVLYKFDQNCLDEEEKWKKRWFIHYVLFQYQLGSRPHESAAIRYGDCKVDKRPDGKVKGIIYISPLTKRGKRTAIMNGNTLRKVQSHLRKGIKLRNEQIEQTNKMIQDELSGVSPAKLRKRFPLLNPETGLIDLRDPVSNDDPLMMNPFLRTKERKMYHPEHIRGWWKDILKQCSFQENYTLYSLRSTHITHALMKGMPIRQVAENVGTSQSEIERTYKRLNNLLNIDDLGFHKESDVSLDPD